MNEIINNYNFGLIDKSEMINQVIEEITFLYCTERNVDVCPMSYIRFFVETEDCTDKVSKEVLEYLTMLGV